MVCESLGNGRFVVYSNCRSDVPVGAVLKTMTSERKKYTDGTVSLEEVGQEHDIDLAIAGVEFWRKPWPCVPYGHKAGVQLTGNDVELLENYLAEHPVPWHVFIGSAAGG